MHIYLAGPYTLPRGGEAENTRKALLVAEELRKVGHKVFVPHLMYSGWAGVFGLTWQQVMDECLAWVTRCDALVRLPGESRGADAEAELAEDLGLTVYHWEGLKLPLQLEREHDGSGSG